MEVTSCLFRNGYLAGFARVSELEHGQVFQFIYDPFGKPEAERTLQ